MKKSIYLLLLLPFLAVCQTIPVGPISAGYFKSNAIHAGSTSDFCTVWNATDKEHKKVSFADIFAAYGSGGDVPSTRTISTTSPLSGGGDLSTNRTLSISQSNTSTPGYLSSTDWNTFNGKQNLISIASTRVPYGNGFSQLTSEAALNYNETTDQLNVENIGVGNMDSQLNLKAATVIIGNSVDTGFPGYLWQGRGGDKSFGLSSLHGDEILVQYDPDVEKYYYGNSTLTVDNSTPGSEKTTFRKLVLDSDVTAITGDEGVFKNNDESKNVTINKDGLTINNSLSDDKHVYLDKVGITAIDSASPLVTQHLAKLTSNVGLAMKTADNIAGTVTQNTNECENDYNVNWPNKPEGTYHPLFIEDVPVTSVNTQTGAVVLTQDNVGDGTTYKQYSATEKTKLAGIAIGANVGVVPNGAITGATKTKITYDTKGLVTAGADATTADIADSTNKRYQTDNQNTRNDATSSIQTQLNVKLAKDGSNADTPVVLGVYPLTASKLRASGVNDFVEFVNGEYNADEVGVYYHGAQEKIAVYNPGDLKYIYANGGLSFDYSTSALDTTGSVNAAGGLVSNNGGIIVNGNFGNQMILATNFLTDSEIGIYSGVSERIATLEQNGNGVGDKIYLYGDNDIQYNKTTTDFTLLGNRILTEVDKPIKIFYSTTGTATTTFTVTIGATMPDTSYVVSYPMAENLLSSVNWRVSNKTTTTFEVVTVTGLTGTVAFECTVTP